MKKQPNFLFLFPDSHRGDWMPYDAQTLQELGMKEIGLRMPHVRQLMEDGVTFTKAVTPSPLCAPARACLAAGVRYDRCETFSNRMDFPLDKRTYYAALKDCGYRVGGVGKLDLHKPTHWWGLDGWIDELGKLGFTDAVDNAGKIDAVVSGKETPKDPYMNDLYKRGLAQAHIEDMTTRKGQGVDPTPLPDDAYCDNWLTDNGIRMLRSYPINQPWFLMVNFTGPHGPWDVTTAMKDAWKDASLPLPHQGDLNRSENELDIRRNYAAMLENIDNNIGRLLAEVESRGELDNTIVIYSSDHGEMLGDFQRFGKCSPYRGSVHIPLVMKGPDIQRGVRSDSLVELQDLAATITDYAGTTMAEAVDSLSLQPILAGKTIKHRNYQLSAMNSDNNHVKVGWRMINDGKYKLNIWEDREPELFDILEDPWENDNIASRNQESVTQLQRLANEGGDISE